MASTTARPSGTWEKQRASNKVAGSFTKYLRFKGRRGAGVVGILSFFLFNASVFGSDLPLTKIRIGSKILEVELAVSETQQMKGLMHRTELHQDRGMLFVFSQPKKASFWMKNTFIPLSIGFFDKNKKLLNILDMEPMRSESQIPNDIYE